MFTRAIQTFVLFLIITFVNGYSIGICFMDFRRTCTESSLYKPAEEGISFILFSFQKYCKSIEICRSLYYAHPQQRSKKIIQIHYCCFLFNLHWDAIPISYFSHLKYTIQCLLLHSENCGTITTIIQHFHDPQRKPHITQLSPRLPVSPSLRQTPIYFLSLQSCLFGMFHVNGITRYEVLCDQFLSRNISFPGFKRVVAHINCQLFLPIAQHYFTLWTKYLPVHQLMGLCVVSTF